MSSYRTASSVPHESTPAQPLVVTEGLPRRPQVITFAAASMVATAAFGLVISVAAYASLYHFNAMFGPDVAPVGATDHAVGRTQTTVQAALVTIAIAALALSLVLALLTSPVLRGNRGARVGAWAICAVGTACAVVILIAMIITHSAVSARILSTAGSPVVQAAGESIPAWYPGTTGLLALMQALGFITTAILLSAPAAGAFFQRVMHPWRPGSEPH